MALLREKRKVQAEGFLQGAMPKADDEVFGGSVARAVSNLGGPMLKVGIALKGSEDQRAALEEKKQRLWEGEATSEIKAYLAEKANRGELGTPEQFHTEFDKITTNYLNKAPTKESQQRLKQGFTNIGIQYGRLSYAEQAATNVERARGSMISIAGNLARQRNSGIIPEEWEVRDAFSPIAGIIGDKEAEKHIQEQLLANQRVQMERALSGAFANGDVDSIEQIVESHPDKWSEVAAQYVIPSAQVDREFDLMLKENKLPDDNIIKNYAARAALGTSSSKATWRKNSGEKALEYMEKRALREYQLQMQVTPLIELDTVQKPDTLGDDTIAKADELLDKRKGALNSDPLDTLVAEIPSVSEAWATAMEDESIDKAMQAIPEYIMDHQVALQVGVNAQRTYGVEYPQYLPRDLAQKYGQKLFLEQDPAKRTEMHKAIANIYGPEAYSQVHGEINMELQRIVKANKTEEALAPAWASGGGKKKTVEDAYLDGLLGK